MENNIPTAEEVYNDFHFNYKGDENSILEAMREFAKLHVEAALKVASENAEAKYNWRQEIDKESILNAYPLDQIK
jgi:hypothetical protein